LNLYSRGRVLKIASFEGPMILRDAQNFKKLDSVHKWEYQEKARIEKKTCPLKKGMVKAVAD